MFSERLKKIRKLKYSQQEMADFLGITRQGYGKYETGKAEPDLATLNKISDILGVSTDYLIKGDERIDEILNNPTTLIAARDGEMTVEEAREVLKWLLEKGFDKK
ncbi:MULTISPECIES: helix-turn-helix domain-containing protein [Bacillus]|uniref:helix-turn-helix domain-containing protein n=1 Tax=Bacillus TaxID=1386 RepID=UPI000B4DB861|nr:MULTISPECIES: helix-turn-helix transcriptional regulator [Bacillus]MCX2854239.1 helix-turn-helix transcriptional regulator [Bacillus sp. KeR2]MCZ4246613.1 helix-turn-helix transcriptional regulator [Bacillus amyloliquefaciens]MEC2238629.1 helix-turn-helix transcriptional regulator [Bacillus velezensis]MED3508046.1 helix-turn-helix transcriptional regulator [Bacillus velezensis]OWP58563.1 transcriptional regulator [Bacillus velezensis]